MTCESKHQRPKPLKQAELFSSPNSIKIMRSCNPLQGWFLSKQLADKGTGNTVGYISHHRLTVSWYLVVQHIACAAKTLQAGRKMLLLVIILIIVTKLLTVYYHYHGNVQHLLLPSKNTTTSTSTTYNNNNNNGTSHRNSNNMQ